MVPPSHIFPGPKSSRNPSICPLNPLAYIFNCFSSQPMNLMEVRGLKPNVRRKIIQTSPSSTNTPFGKIMQNIGLLK